MPFLKDQEVQDEHDSVDVEDVQENERLPSSEVQSKGLFESIEIVRRSSSSIKQEDVSKEENAKTSPGEKNSQQTKPKSQSAPVAKTTNAVVSRYPTPPFVSQEEPRDIEIAVPMTTVTPTSSPFKRKTAPSAQNLINLQRGFWKSISKDVIESSDEEDVADEGEDHDDGDDGQGVLSDGEDAAKGSEVSKSVTFLKESNPKDFVARSNDSPKSLLWLKQPNISTPSSVECSKGSKTMVTERVFESGEHTFSKEKPEGATYFSISSRPKQRPTVESPEMGESREVGVVSSLSKRQESSSDSFMKVSAPASNKKKSNKRRISSHEVKQDVPKKRSKTEAQKSEKKSAFYSSQSDDNSDNCFVILSRDPKIEELLSAKKKSAPSKKKRTSSFSGNDLVKKQKTLVRLDIEDSTESSDFDAERDAGEFGTKDVGDGTHAAQVSLMNNILLNFFNNK